MSRVGPRALHKGSKTRRRHFLDLKIKIACLNASFCCNDEDTTLRAYAFILRKMKFCGFKEKPGIFFCDLVSLIF